MATTPDSDGIPPLGTSPEQIGPAKIQAEIQAETEAMTWLLALEEQPADAELNARFQIWLQAAPGNAAAWAAILGTYAALGDVPLADVPVADVTMAGANVVVLPSRRRPFPRYAAFAAAACLALVAAAGMLAQTRFHLGADYASGTAATRDLALADGSRIDLGPGSAVDVAFSDTAREIDLRAGAAYFDVAPDAARPFTVHAGGVAVTALGTAFEVAMAGDGVRVALDHGSVRVQHDGKSTELAPGDWLRIGRDGNAPATETSGTQPVDTIAAWRGGHLIARDSTIGDVVAELERSSSGIILVPDSALAGKRVTGVYNLADPAAALAAIAATHGATIGQVTPWVTILSPRNR